MKLLYSIITSVAITSALSVPSAQAQATFPLTLEFSDQSSFDSWSTINANNDDYQWTFNATEVAAEMNSSKAAASDYIISPAIELQAGRSYKVTAFVKSSGSYDYQDFKILAANSPVASELDANVLLSETKFRVNMYYAERSGNFNPSTSGNYNFAIQCTSSRYNGSLYLQKMTVTEIVPHPGKVIDITAEAAPNGLMEATLSWTWPSDNDMGGALSSITGAKIYRGTTSSFSVSESSLVGTVDGGEPGSKGSWVDKTVTEPGKYYYKIVPFNEDGESTLAPSASSQSNWIGPDTSLSSLKNVTATADPDNEKAVTLTWDTPAGSNGGWVDPSAVTYKIVRSGASTGDVTLEEAWSGELPYRDATIPGLDSYTYKITTTYNGKTSWSATSSNAVTTGGAMALPYSQDFSATNSFDLFTVFHGADCNRDWTRSASAANYWGNPADAWLLTPRFHLETGKAYSLSFTARVNRASSPKNLYVYTGTEANAENLEQSQIFHEEISNTLAGAGAREMIVNVQTTGDYYIAFRCFGPSDSNDLYVDDIKFEEIEITPDVVAEAKVTAADAGALSAIVSWTNPDKTNAGSTLEAVSAIEISDGTNVVATVTEGLVPGSPASVAVPVDGAGFHSFSIVALSGEKRSKAVATDKAWIGPDTPVAVTNLTVTDTPDGRVVSFDAPTASVNGGYVDFDALTYTVSRNEDVLDDHLTATTFTDIDKDLSLAKYTYSVTAAYLDNVSEAVTSVPMVLGDALTLPYQPSFDKENREHFDLWLSTDNDGNQNTGWKYDTSKQGFQSSNKDQWAFTPPILMEQGSVELAFKASCYNGRNTEEMDVYLTQSTNPSDRPATDPAANEVSAMADAPLFKLVHSSSVEDVNWPSEEKVAVSVPQYGIYRFAFHNKTGNMYLTLHQANVTQTGTTGIENVSTGTSALIRVEGSTIVANGAVSVYNLAGECVASGEGQLSTASLLPGLYIAVDANGNSLKFQR